MKKFTKLLSVLLAVVMILSTMSVMAFATPAKYKTVSDLDTNKAYGPNGTVTRLNTDERMSIVFDALDELLGSTPGLNMGELFNLGFGGLALTVNLSSIDNVCETLDGAKDLLHNNGWVAIAKPLLGMLKDLKLQSWVFDVDRQSTTTNQLEIVKNLTLVLKDNTGLVQTVLSTGKLDLGVANSALKGLDLSAIADIPSAIKKPIFALMTRWDDTTEEATALYNRIKGDGNMQAQLDLLITNLLTKPMSIGTYTEDASGTCTSNMTLKDTGEYRNLYHKVGDTIQVDYFDPATGTRVTNDPKELYTKTEILNSEDKGTGVYKYVNEDGYELQYYYNDSAALRSLAEAMTRETNPLTIKPGEESATSILFKFIPYMFEDMAVVVLNGSLKKILAEWFGAYFIYEGEKGKLENTTIPADDLAKGYDTFFNADQGDYIWGWSDYQIINGTPYYRYEDSFYRGVISGTNEYYDLINWEYDIPANLFDEFIPGADGKKASAKGYTSILQGLNDWLIKVITLVVNQDEAIKAKFDVSKLVAGDNSHLVANAKYVAQSIVKIAPERIFGKDPTNDPYYQLMMTADDPATTADEQAVLSGLAATIIKLVMPQFILPTAASLEGNGVGAILAAVIRELATQFLPNVNYDALIYENYETRELKKNTSNKYWLNVILTIATDIGVKYMQAFVDLGTDTAAWPAMDWSDDRTYAATDVTDNDATIQKWEARVDYIIDWAFQAPTVDAEWQHGFSKLVSAGQTFNAATVENPWVKLGALLNAVLPINQVFNINTADENWLRTLLRDDFILAIADLQLEKIAGGATATGVLNVPVDTVLRNTNTYDAIVKVIRDLLNNLVKEVAGTTLIPDSVSTIDAVFNQANITGVVVTLVGALNTAYNNGLLVPVLPLVNLLLGWKTTQQEMNSPSISFSNEAGKGYFYSANATTVSSTINIKNNANGMLNKHKNGTEDKDYVLYIDGVESSDTTFKSTVTFPIEILPGAKGSVPFTFDYTGEKATSVTVKYHYDFKDGNQVGGIQKLTNYNFISKDIDLLTDATYYAKLEDYYDVPTGDLKNTYQIAATLDSTPKAVVVDSYDDMVKYINDYNLYFTNLSAHYTMWITSAPTYNIPNFATVNGFVYGANKPSAGAMNGHITKDPSYAPLDVFTFNTAADTSAIKNGPQYIDLGTMDVTWHNTSSTKYNWKGWYDHYEDGGNNNITFTGIDFGDIYIIPEYAKLKTLVNECKSVQRDDYAADATNEWAAMVTALSTAMGYTDRPLTKANYDANMYATANLTSAYEALLAAREALENKLAKASTEKLEAAYEKCAPKEGDAYQNYELFEYFEYQSARSYTTERIDAYKAPVAPEKRIPGEGLSAKAIDELLAAETNEKTKFALNATVETPSDKEIEDWKEAVANFKTPTYTDLQNADLAARLTYYNKFLRPVKTSKDFLDTEISRIENTLAPLADEGKYAEQSWDAYQNALTEAKAVNKDADALQSEVFTAKYALMVAYNNLLKKDMSALENPTDDMKALKDLIPKAKDIFTNPANYKVKEGVTEKDAYAQLIKALGYKTEDGAYLYGATALDLTENDRELNNYNIWLIGDVKANLEAAMANFESAAVPELIPSESGEGTVVISKDFCTTSGKYAGAIFGVDTLEGGQDLADYLDTPAGSFRINKVKTATGEKVTTGATVDLLAEDGVTVIETYVFVYFGDVNCDGYITSADAGDILSHDAWDIMLEEDSAAYVASNVNGDAYITSADAGDILSHDAWDVMLPSQAEIAAKFA